MRTSPLPSLTSEPPLYRLRSGSGGISVHLKNGFFVPNGGYEYTLVLAAAAVALAFTGPGALSLDQAFGISWSGGTWGRGALAAGLIGAALPLMTRKMAGPSTVQDAA